jgi:integrase
MNGIDNIVMQHLLQNDDEKTIQKLARELYPQRTSQKRRTKMKIEYGYISVEDFEKIISKITKRDKMYSVMLGLMRYRGLRPNEVVKLRIQDIKPDGSFLHHSTKTGRISVMELPECFRQQFLDYIENNKHRFINGYLFSGLTSKYEHIQVSQLRKKFRHYFRTAGLNCDFHIDTNKALSNTGRKLNHVRLYDLRASFGTDVQRLGRDLFTTSVMLRHGDTRTAHVYMRKAVLINEKNTLNEVFKKQHKNTAKII